MIKLSFEAESMTDLLEKLKEAVEGLSGSAPAVKTGLKAVGKTTPKKPETGTGDDTADEGVVIDQNAVRAAAAVKIKAGKSAAVKKIFTKYGAEGVSALAEEHYADVHAAIEKL